MILECPNCGKRFHFRPTVLDGKEYIECEFCGAELQIDILEDGVCCVCVVQDPNQEIMKKEELIEHWMLLAKTVFVAEDNIIDEWKPKLEASKNASAIVKEQIADAYLRAIATEIIEKWYEK